MFSAKIVKTVPCDYDETYYDAWLDIYYSGSHYVQVEVAEEGSGSIVAYFSNRPFYTQLRLRDIDSWVDATVTILIRNDYGSEKYKIVIPGSCEYISEIRSEMRACEALNLSGGPVDVYTLNGIYKMTCSGFGLKDIDADVYILKYIDSDGNVKRVKKIIK